MKSKKQDSLKVKDEILKTIKQKAVGPLYVFDGEEAYFIDELCDAFENHLLEPHERDFNLTILYGRDTDWARVVNECRSYPSFAERRLVILKEASNLKDMIKLIPYLQNPNPSTTLVIAHKHKKLDGRTALPKIVAAHGVYLTFDPIKDYKIPEWIAGYCIKSNIQISPANTALLAEYLGTDLQKIANELDKVLLNTGESREVTRELIEKYIGVSCDYNSFQFAAAIIQKNKEMAFKIVQYFIANPKDGPLVVVTATLYNEFSKLYRYHYSRDLPEAQQVVQMKISPFFIKDYRAASSKYNLTQTIQAIHLIQQFNLHAVGYGIANNDQQLLKELTAKIFML
ncbi:MAG: DNA polymerase III subunit delta [Chitinophagaceae bacterium]|nr:DNA polymerase III subunit delta [Chitinophagaceae bacterium]